VDVKLQGAELGWNYNLYLLRSISSVNFGFGDGYENVPAVEKGLTGASGAAFLNPFGPQSAAGQAYLDENALRGPMQYARSQLDAAGLQINREILHLPAGPVALALGVEGRHEEASFETNPLASSAIGSGLAVTNESGDRSIGAVMGEVRIPLAAKLDLDASGRFDHYSDVGNTSNPKVSLRYQPLRRLLLRASYGTAFRAPTLYDIHAPVAYSVSSTRNNDPVLCPGGVPDVAAGAIQTRDCDTTFDNETGGNPNLLPEQSTSYDFGSVVQITRTLSIGVDYYRYLLRESISTLTNTAILEHPAQFGDLIVRCSQVPGSELSIYTTCDNPAGDPIAYTVGTGLNLGDTRTSGLDLTMQWSSGETRFGEWVLSYNATDVLDYAYQLQPYGPFYNADGQYSVNGFPVIRYSQFASLSWQSHAWMSQLSNRLESGYTDCNAQCGIAPAYFNRVGVYSLWNLSFGYRHQESRGAVSGLESLQHRSSLHQQEQRTWGRLR
jgi:iron complex outermembrane receptor protein